MPLPLEKEGMRTHCTMLGIGHLNQLDTYLSPQEYTGTQVRLLQENTKNTKLIHGRVTMQNLIQANGGYSQSRTDKGKYMSGMLEWQMALLHHWHVLPRLTLLAGPQLGTHLGFLYNTRNGNNPAQARLSADLGISGAALYRFVLWKKTMDLRYQASLQLGGLMFSPQYGQSYYEIFSLGHSDHNICFTSPFAAPNIDQLITLDAHLGKGTLRIGLQGLVRQSHVNEIKTHDWSFAFLVGYVKNFQLVLSR